MKRGGRVAVCHNAHTAAGIVIDNLVDEQLGCRFQIGKLGSLHALGSVEDKHCVHRFVLWGSRDREGHRAGAGSVVCVSRRLVDGNLACGQCRQR